MRGFGGATGTPHDAPYFTSVEFEGEHWGDVSHPAPYTFNLRIPDDAALGVHDFEFSVAGRPGSWYDDQHFFVEVIPEPGTFVLLAMGLGALGLGVWRRRKQAA